MKTLKYTIGILLLLLSLNSLGQGKNVTVFYNSSFIDTFSGGIAAEGPNTVASLQLFGHNVTTFTGFTASAISTAVAGKDVLVIPEQERGDLNSVISASGRNTIRSYIQNGGTLIIMYSPVSMNLVNSTLGWSLSPFGVGTSGLISGNASGTFFAGGPSSLQNFSATTGIATTSLPAGSIPIYRFSSSFGSGNTVVIMPFGAGQVIYIGWDWFNARPRGSNDGGWLTVLDRAVRSATGADTQAPNVLTKNITVSLDASGNASIVAADVDDGSTDNVGITSLTVNPSTFDCSNLGSNIVTLTASDAASNVASAGAFVTVVDNLAPIVITQDVTVSLNAAGNASITTAQINNGSSDNCGISSFQLDVSSFDCSNLGTNTVRLTAKDGSSNSTTATATVTVRDITTPAVSTKPLTVALDASGNASITAAQIDNGSSDNCGLVSLTIDKSNFDCSDLGPNVVRLTGVDASSNTSTASNIVTVVDNIAPSVLTQDLTVQLDASGNGNITVAQVDNGSTDNCGITSLALDVSTFNCSDIGANTVTLTATDGSSNSASATATVTVVDNIAPSVLTQSLTVALDAAGNASISPSQVNNGSTDNCAITSLSLDVSSFDCGDLGANTVTLTATDGSSNTASGTATVNVVDNIAPTVLTQNITASLDASGNASISAAQIDNGSSDNCAISSLSLDISSFDCSDIGNNTVTLTASDASSNSTSATATVTVVDNLPPIVITKNITVQLDASGNAAITPANVNDGSSDNCGIISLSLNINSFDCNNLGANNVILTATDASSNSASTAATVTVVDNIAPSVITQSVTVALDASGNASITPAQINNGSSDNCTITAYSLDVSSFDCSHIGANKVILTATDASANSTSASATVTVIDITPPTALSQNFTAQLDASGNYDLQASDVNAASFDNCSIASIAITAGKTSYNCSDVGTTYTVELTVTDVNSLSSSVLADVTVSDSDLPDNDNDKISDVCDPDDDNDGIPDEIDKYPFDSTNDDKGSILTFVWDDLNGNGIQDSNEPAIQGNVVELLDQTGSFLRQRSTNADGLVSFFDLFDGEKVKLNYVKKANHAITSRDVGFDDNVDSDISPGNGKTSTITINATEVLMNVDAGMWSPGTVEAFVWDDLNGNGLQDSNEPGIQGVTVKLVKTNNQSIGSTTTDVNGIATLNGVPANQNVKIQFGSIPGYSGTLKDEGFDDSIDSDANKNNGRTAAFKTEGGGQLITHVDAGYQLSSSPGKRPKKKANLASSGSIDHSLDVKLYPNPIDIDFTLEINSNVDEKAVIVIFDQLGKKIVEEEIPLRSGFNRFEMDFSSVSLSAGQYMLNIYPTSQKMKSIKLIKQ